MRIPLTTMEAVFIVNPLHLILRTVLLVIVLQTILEAEFIAVPLHLILRTVLLMIILQAILEVVFVVLFPHPPVGFSENTSQSFGEAR